MNDAPSTFSLSSRDLSAPAPVLSEVQVTGHLDAVMFELRLRQTYRNTSDRVLEVVYTFPLPATAVLLGFASELNGERQEGVTAARPDAERRYEESLEEGDAPVMLEALGDGLHTANIGNLKPGDEIVLETRFAQLLSFEQGRLRVSIPTTIAPRYGSATQAGLQAQQVPLATIEATYPLAVSLTIGAALAGAIVACPTHDCAITHDPDGRLRLDLAAGARLDRDVVVVVTPREPLPSLLLRGGDPFDAAAPVVLMAALQPATGAPRANIALKLLVDCSGSMAGDSIASARAALRGVASGLSEGDLVSLSRFGTACDHLFGPATFRPQTMGLLQPLVDGLQPDMDGTEMNTALAAVFGLRHATAPTAADVLLITDGEIWQADEVIASARRSGHRVFVIGVGSAPAESVLRRLAATTGGACEFATPGEALEAAAQRMLERMRQPVLNNVRLDWGSLPSWTSGPEGGVFGGDTVIAFAGFSDSPPPRAVRLLAEDPQGRTVELARSEAEAPGAGDSLARVAAARRAARAPDADVIALALRYQLLSPHTHCILVHQRADAEKAAIRAELHRVPSMLAAGSSGMGSVRAGGFAVSSPSPRYAYCVALYTPRPRPGPQATLGAMAIFAAHYVIGPGRGAIDGLSADAAGLTLHPEARQTLDEIEQLGLSPDEAWLLLAHWISLRVDEVEYIVLAGDLKAPMAAIDPAMAAAAAALIEGRLGRYAIDDWTSLRELRLQRATGQTQA